MLTMQTWYEIEHWNRHEEEWVRTQVPGCRHRFLAEEQAIDAVASLKRDLKLDPKEGYRVVRVERRLIDEILP